MSDVLFWNEVALEVQRRDFSPAASATGKDREPEQGGPTRTSRALAIVHAAMFNAQVAAAGGAAPYMPAGWTPPPAAGGLVPGAAVAGAAVAALKALWPRQTDYIEGQLREFTKRTATTTADGYAALKSLDHGELHALALLRARKDDGWDRPDETVYAQSPWHHRPDPMKPDQNRLGSHWGHLRPFLIAATTPAGTVDPTLYIAPPPNDPTNPAVHGQPDQVARYDAASKDVQILGAQRSAVRTPGETLTGVFWGYDGAAKLGVPPRLYNQVVRSFLLQSGLPLGETQMAQCLLLVNLAMADGAIVAWGAKYRYDLWRPVIGIRELDPGYGPNHSAGGAPGPLCDPDWLPLGIPRTNIPGELARTPDFPAYPSGHATFGASSFYVLALALEKITDGTPNFRKAAEWLTQGFEFTSDEYNGVNVDPRGDVRVLHVRKLTLAEAIVDNALSRVYLGVHWRFDGLGTELPPQLTGLGLVLNDPAAGASLGSAQEQRTGGVPAGLQVAKEVFGAAASASLI